MASELFCAEIELSCISLCWHEPERLPEFLRELDPALHIFERHLRLILDAINLSYGELGATDWATVIQCVREAGTYEECGGLDGLNEVYQKMEYRSSGDDTDRIFRHYIDCLKEYARARKSDPPPAVHMFTSGKLVMRGNKNKRLENSPDSLGEGSIAGRRYEARGWRRTGADGQPFYDITLIPK